MEFIHFRVNAGPDNVIQVKLSKQANVRLMDSLNYHKYVKKREYSFTGGLIEKSPVDLRPDRKGEWHIIVDLEGLPGFVKASVDVLKS